MPARPAHCRRTPSRAIAESTSGLPRCPRGALTPRHHISPRGSIIHVGDFATAPRTPSRASSSIASARPLLTAPWPPTWSVSSGLRSKACAVASSRSVGACPLKSQSCPPRGAASSRRSARRRAPRPGRRTRRSRRSTASLGAARPAWPRSSGTSPRSTRSRSRGGGRPGSRQLRRRVGRAHDREPRAARARAGPPGRGGRDDRGGHGDPDRPRHRRDP